MYWMNESPLANDGLHHRYSFVSMYVLATTENFPDIMWPFLNCQCSIHNAVGVVEEVWSTKVYSPSLNELLR